MRTTITAVGDIMLDRRLLPPRTFYHYPDVSTCFGTSMASFEGQIRFPFPNTPESVQWLASFDRHVHGIHATSHRADSIALEMPGEAEEHDYPFRGVAAELRQSDLTFGNLECPLTDRGRRMNNDMCYSASPGYARALANAGFRAVSFANNHCMDLGEVGFDDTLAALRQSGVCAVGAGASLDEARRPAVFQVNGVSIAFLAYSMIGPDWVYATATEGGVAPLNPMIVGQDIERIRSNVDLLILSLHWGTEGRSTPWPRTIDLAHDLIDSGADVILGHHSHVPGSVEIYRGRPIFYSLGNFSFGHDHLHWGDNMMVRLQLDDRSLRRIEILPIRGRFQPAVLTGEGAAQFHRRLVEVSRMFGTVPHFDGATLGLEL